MVFGIDVSRYQPKVDWALLKAMGVEFVIIKATQGNYAVDGMLKSHVAGAKAAGLLIGLYHWCDPLAGDTAQAQYFLDKTSGLDYGFVAADVEQQWADWQEWGAGKITKILAPQRIEANAHNFLEYCRVKGGKKVVLYSRASFIQAYARPMLAWINDYPLWMAHYPYGEGRVTASWEEIKGKYYPSIAGPNLPNGAKTWLFWQYSGDKFLPPGVFADAGGLKRSPTDLNLWNGSLAELRAFCGVGGAEPVPAALTIEDRVLRLEKRAVEKGWVL